MRHESTVSFSCSGTRFPKPPSRAICLHQADGQPSRGGASRAIKPVHLATIPKRGQGDTRASDDIPFWPIHSNEGPQAVESEYKPRRKHQISVKFVDVGPRGPTLFVV